MFSSATQPPRRPPPGHNFVVSAITFEGSEMARNAIESEFWTSNMADRSEMARYAIESDFRTSKMAAEKKQ